MSTKLEKSLTFKGTTIVLLEENGTWWIAIKPICEALGINYDRQYKNLKKNKFLGQLYAEQHTVAADGKLRNMICLPEFFIYGWLFQLKTNVPGLEQYQWECYKVLHQHFHGTITGRKELIKEKADSLMKIDGLKCKVFASTEAKELEALDRQRRAIDRKLKKLDKDQLEKELILFK